MNPQSARDKFSSRLDGLLDEEEARRFDEYLASSPECRAEYESFKRMVAEVGDLPPVPVPDDLMDDLRTAFRDELTSSSSETAPEISLFQRLGTLRIAAAVGALAFTVFLLAERGTDESVDSAPAAREVGAADSATPRPGRLRRFGDDHPEAKAKTKAPAETSQSTDLWSDEEDVLDQGEMQEDDDGFRWKTFERQYDRIVGGRLGEAGGGSVESEIADAAVRLVEAAKELSDRDGLMSSLGRDDAGFLGALPSPEEEVEELGERGIGNAIPPAASDVERGREAPKKGAPVTGAPKGGSKGEAKGAPKAAPSKSARSKTRGTSDSGATTKGVPGRRASGEGSQTPGAPSKSTPTPGKAAPEPEAMKGEMPRKKVATPPAPMAATRCYFLFGAKAREVLGEKARKAGGVVAVRSIEDLGQAKKQKSPASPVGELVSVTLPEARLETFLEGLSKEPGLALRLFSRRTQGESSAEKPDAVSHEADERATVTLHFIVPR